ncbi:SDR family NAD(P)-dependent oxidoreductase [Paenibacillus piri]|nr:SDR family NAD(P)-dependent oxidoreductase [Paenibacillus piri]
MSLDFTHRTVLVTGAGSGIGRAIAAGFLDAGANVIASDINMEQLNELRSRHGCASGRPLHILRTDVREREQVLALFESNPFGRLDAVVHAAGITASLLLTETDDETYRKLIETNVNGTFHVLQEAVSVMRDNAEGGTIVVIGSINAMWPLANQAVYTATKAAIDSLAKSLAVEVAPLQIRVNVVAPGAIDTPMNHRLTGERKAALAARIPLRRIGIPEDLVGITQFLSSPLSSYITGSTFVVDGGFIVGR